MEKETNRSCTLRLLGPLQIEQAKNLEAPRFRSQRTQALLGYLVARQRPVSRDSLALLFWPDETIIIARANLRRELHNLNRVLPNCWQTDQTVVRFIPSPETMVDIYEVNRLEAAAAFTTAVSWLGGEFLEGLALPQSPEFEAWLDGERERWRQQTEHVLLQAADAFWASDEADLAQRTLSSLVHQFPWHEEGHRRLMLLLARQGRYTAALRQFERCREALAVELAIAPTPATDVLYRRIKMAAEQRPQPLPPFSTPFVGRQTELTALRQRLLNPACRLVTITGLGGMGKSRLALQAARTYAEAESSIFLHGAAFVSLVGIVPDDLPTAIATAVNIHLHGKQSAEIQLLEQLQEREMLLLLDNYEHFLPETALIEKILAKAPDITLLITSRAPLRLQEEWIFPIEGLSYPPPNLEKRDVSTFAAVQLFASIAERTQPPFTLAQYQQSVVNICRLVEGLPLAILLAASQLEKVDPPEILGQIKHNLDFLQSPYRNLPMRQQSLRAVFEAAWSQLNKPDSSGFCV